MKGLYCVFKYPDIITAHIIIAIVIIIIIIISIIIIIIGSSSSSGSGSGSGSSRINHWRKKRGLEGSVAPRGRFVRVIGMAFWVWVND